MENLRGRKTYRNGDEVSLFTGCDSCTPSFINGHLCHETGCSNSWRDFQAECFECGCDFWREEMHQSVCPDCISSDCEEVYDED